MAWVFNIADRRKAQLRKEDYIDDKLKKVNTCDNIIKEYLLYCREKNREQCNNVFEKNIFSQYELIKENIDQTDNHLDQIIKKLDNDEDPCIFLQSFINK